MPIHAPFLKYFLEVARCGSVRLASSRLFISSSAVNRQILKVEGELGTRLFDRSVNGMQLTAAGHLLVAHAERTLADADSTLTAIIDLQVADDRPVTIAGQESVIGEFLSPVLLQFHHAWPGCCSAFKAAGGDGLDQLLIDAEADVVVAFDARNDPAVKSISERELSVGAIVSPEHPLAGRDSVTLKDCDGYPLILPDGSWPLRRQLDAMLDVHEGEASIISTSNSVEFLRSMIDRQLGVGFQTAMGIESSLDKGQLVKVPLCDPEPIRQMLGIRVSKTARHSPPFESLVTLLSERLTSYADRWS